MGGGEANVSHHWMIYRSFLRLSMFTTALWLVVYRNYRLCILACLALVFYPHAPTYNVCNSEIDWNSVFSSLESLTIGVDYRVAISVDNGNRFAIEVNSLAAEFDFNGQSVATIDFREPVLLVPASITDVVVPIKFSVGSPYQAAELYSAYTSKNLQLKANALLKGTAAGFYSFEMSIKDHVVDMSAKIDTSLCAPCREA